MNWITKFIKPKIKSLFKKRLTKSDESSLWSTCECKNLIYKVELFNNLSVLRPVLVLQIVILGL